MVFSHLPFFLKRHIFSYLDAPTVVAASLVCQEWRQISLDPELWRVLLWRDYGIAQARKAPAKRRNAAADTPSKNWFELYKRMVSSGRVKYSRAAPFRLNFLSSDYHGDCLDTLDFSITPNMLARPRPKKGDVIFVGDEFEDFDDEGEDDGLCHCSSEWSSSMHCYSVTWDPLEDETVQLINCGLVFAPISPLGLFHNHNPTADATKGHKCDGWGGNNDDLAGDITFVKHGSSISVCNVTVELNDNVGGNLEHFFHPINDSLPHITSIPTQMIHRPPEGIGPSVPVDWTKTSLTVHVTRFIDEEGNEDDVQTPSIPQHIRVLAITDDTGDRWAQDHISNLPFLETYLCEELGDTDLFVNQVKILRTNPTLKTLLVSATNLSKYSMHCIGYIETLEYIELRQCSTQQEYDEQPAATDLELDMEMEQERESFGRPHDIDKELLDIPCSWRRLRRLKHVRFVHSGPISGLDVLSTLPIRSLYIAFDIDKKLAFPTQPKDWTCLTNLHCASLNMTKDSAAQFLSTHPRIRFAILNHADLLRNAVKGATRMRIEESSMPVDDIDDVMLNYFGSDRVVPDYNTIDSISFFNEPDEGTIRVMFDRCLSKSLTNEKFQYVHPEDHIYKREGKGPYAYENTSHMTSDVGPPQGYCDPTGLWKSVGFIDVMDDGQSLAVVNPGRRLGIHLTGVSLPARRNFLSSPIVKACDGIKDRVSEMIEAIEAVGKRTDAMIKHVWSEWDPDYYNDIRAVLARGRVYDELSGLISILIDHGMSLEEGLLCGLSWYGTPYGHWDQWEIIDQQSPRCLAAPWPIGLTDSPYTMSSVPNIDRLVPADVESIQDYIINILRRQSLSLLLDKPVPSIPLLSKERLLRGASKLLLRDLSQELCNYQIVIAEDQHVIMPHTVLQDAGPAFRLMWHEDTERMDVPTVFVPAIDLYDTLAKAVINSHCRRTRILGLQVIPVHICRRWININPQPTSDLDGDRLYTIVNDMLVDGIRDEDLLVRGEALCSSIMIMGICPRIRHSSEIMDLVKKLIEGFVRHIDIDLPPRSPLPPLTDTEQIDWDVEKNICTLSMHPRYPGMEWSDEEEDEESWGSSMQTNQGWVTEDSDVDDVSVEEGEEDDDFLDPDQIEEEYYVLTVDDSCEIPTQLLCCGVGLWYYWEAKRNHVEPPPGLKDSIRIILAEKYTQHGARTMQMGLQVLFDRMVQDDDVDAYLSLHPRMIGLVRVIVQQHANFYAQDQINE